MISEDIPQKAIDSYYAYHFELNGEMVLKYNSYYKSFTAAYARSTGLPMFGSSELSKNDYTQYANKWLSKTRCKAIKKPVRDNELPVAWWRVKNGYTPLYDRSEEHLWDMKNTKDK